jgi:hypothetical protein
MYCPKCGSNQGDGKRFCTICGTNLQIITQALSGQLPPVHSFPPIPHPYEIERQRETAKGVKLSIIGGGFIAYKFFSAIFSGGSFLGVLSFVGFILLAVGVSKLIAYRTEATYSPHLKIAPTQQSSYPQNPTPPPNSQPTVISAPRTSELPHVQLPLPSVTEDDTRHFPHHSPQ